MVEIAGPPVPPSSSDQPSDPQRVSVGPAGDVDSQAITRDSIDGDDLASATLSDPQQSAAGTAIRDAELDRSAEVPEPPVSGDPAVHQDASGPLPIGWQSDRTRRARQIGLITTLSITGLAAAAVAFLFFVQRWQERQAQGSRAANAVVETSEEVADVSASPLSEPADETESDEETVVEPSPVQNAATADADDAKGPDEATTLDHDGSSGIAGQDAETPEQQPVQESTQKFEQEGGVAGTAVDAASEADPSELMPESILGPLTSEDDAVEAVAPATPQLPPGLQKYTSLLAIGNEDGREEEPLEMPQSVEELKLDEPAAEEETAFGPAKPLNFSRRLQFEVAFEKKAAPLSQWLRVLSQVTGVPISLDVASLDAAGIPPTEPAEPVSGWTTAEAVLEAVARSAGCTIRKTDSLVVVEANAEAVTAGTKPALHVDDLLADTGNPEQSESLVRLIQRVTQAESAAIDPETGEVSVEGGPSTAWLTALVLDGLRIARQLPPRLPRERTQRWLAIDRGFDWPPVVAGRGIEPLDHPQPIISLTGQIAEVNDATVVFAWGALWQHGLTPESTAMPWAANATGGELFDRMLQPYQLQVRQMSDDLWWVGSQALYDRDRAIGLIHLSDQAADVTMERLARSLGATDAEELSVAYDGSSGYLVAQLPRFVLRQLPALVGEREANQIP